MVTTYAKLRSGEWGVRVQGSAPAKGAKVTVSKKDGTSKVETIVQVVWSGNGVALCAIAGASAPASPRASGGTRRGGCPSGGNCSSFGSGKSCGAADCDGW
jgi:hypothetical protein